MLMLFNGVIVMRQNIKVITGNNYFFLGVAAHLCGEGQSVSKLSFCELKNMPASYFNKNDVLIFQASNYSEELSFLILMASFAGRVIFITSGGKVRSNIAFKHHASLATRANIDVILNEINKKHDNAAPSIRMAKDIFTRREKSILLHAINGMDVPSISKALKLSIKTVYCHRRNALQKLGGRNLFEIWPVKGQLWS